MIYYCKRNETGEIVGVGVAPSKAAIPAGHETCTEAERDEWLAQLLAAQAEEAKRPTPAEQLRADVDYLAALQGVSL